MLEIVKAEMGRVAFVLPSSVPSICIGAALVRCLISAQEPEDPPPEVAVVSKGGWDWPKISAGWRSNRNVVVLRPGDCSELLHVPSYPRGTWRDSNASSPVPGMMRELLGAGNQLLGFIEKAELWGGLEFLCNEAGLNLHELPLNRELRSDEIPSRSMVGQVLSGFGGIGSTPTILRMAELLQSAAAFDFGVGNDLTRPIHQAIGSWGVDGGMLRAGLLRLALDLPFLSEAARGTLVERGREVNAALFAALASAESLGNGAWVLERIGSALGHGEVLTLELVVERLGRIDPVRVLVSGADSDLVPPYSIRLFGEILHRIMRYSDEEAERKFAGVLPFLRERWQLDRRAGLFFACTLEEARLIARRIAAI